MAPGTLGTSPGTSSGRRALTKTGQKPTRLATAKYTDVQSYTQHSATTREAYQMLDDEVKDKLQNHFRTAMSNLGGAELDDVLEVDVQDDADAAREAHEQAQRLLNSAILIINWS